jgi:hypothetical protein
MRFSKKNEMKSIEFSNTISKLKDYQELLSNVNVLVDIGVSDGRFIDQTKPLFPSVERVIGIDPIEEYQRVCDFEYVEALIGEKCKEVEFSISADLFTSSKLYPGVRSKSLNQRRMDCLLDSLEIDNELVLFVKIDTQGSDLECLSSFGRYLEAISLVIVEVQMKPFAIGMDYFSESISKISALGFEVCEFLNPINRARDSTLGQIDLLLAPRDSRIMRDLKW